MAYLAITDFRAATATTSCLGITMETTDISDANLTALIAEMSHRFDRYTGDHFEAETGATATADGTSELNLFFPKRLRAVTSVTVTWPGGATTVVPTSYYAFEPFTDDFFQIPHPSTIDLKPGLNIYPGGWPAGSNNVSVVGDFSWLTCPTEVKRAVALACWERVTVDGSTAIAGPGDANCFSRLAEAQSIADFFRRPIDG